MLGKNFWLFRMAQIVSAIGNQLAVIAISFYILAKTGSALKMAIVAAPAGLVGLFLTLFLGPLADKFERKKFIAIGNFIKSITWVLIIVFLLLDKLNIPVLCVFSVVSAIAGAITDSGSAGFLPELVSEKNIQKAYQTITGTNSATNIIGGIFAGIIVGVFGITLSLVINAVTFLYVTVTTLLIKPQFSSSKIKKGYSEQRLLFSTWKIDFCNGLKYVIARNKGHHSLHYVYIAILAIQFVVAPLQIALPVFVKNYLHEAPKFLGILLSAEGLGAILAAMLLEYLEVKKDYLVLLGFWLLAASIFCLGTSFNKIFSVFLVICMGIGATIVGVILNSALLKIIHEPYRSRFFTIISFAQGIIALIGLLFSGYLIDYFGVMKIFLAVGIGLFALISLLAYKGREQICALIYAKEFKI